MIVVRIDSVGLLKFEIQNINKIRFQPSGTGCMACGALGGRDNRPTVRGDIAGCQTHTRARRMHTPEPPKRKGAGVAVG